MRTRRTAVTLAAAAIIAVALGGCVQTSPPVIPTAEPSSKPVFASDAEALAAAKKAYVAYLKVSDEVAVDGGLAPERFDSVVTRSWLSNEITSAKRLSSSKRQQVGASSAIDISLQQRSESHGVASVSVYACLDLSGVEYVDTGSGLNPSAPIADLVPIEVDLASSESRHDILLVERNAPWQGKNFCPQH